MKLQKNSYEVKAFDGKIKSPLEALKYQPRGGQDNHEPQNESPIKINARKDEKTSTFVPKLYARRWLYLVIAVILNLSDGALWICYASVANVSASYYNVSINAINWLSMIFFIVYLPVIFVAMWIFDKWGFKAGMYWGCGTNLVGSVVRLFGTFDFVPPSYRFPITIAGQIIAALTQPFCMCMPTKISQDWFPENQRTISTTAVSLSNLLGSMIACLISPAIATTPEDIPLMNIVICGFGIFAGAIGILVRESIPKFPPSVSAAKDRERKHQSSIKSYLRDLKKLLINKQFMLLMFSAASFGVGLVYTFLTVLQQMLCSFNYSNAFSGICTAIMIAGGIVGSPLFTFIAEKTKRLEEIVAITFSFSVLIDIVLILICNIQDILIPIAIVSAILGVLNLGVYPVCLEVAVEITYPIEQSISAGIIACWQQIIGAALVPLVTSVGKPLNNYQMHHQTCTTDLSTTVNDMTYGGICLVGIVTFFNIILLIFFKPTFKRSELEKIKSQQKLQLKINNTDKRNNNN